MSLIWVSRTLPAAEATAARLKARGYDSLIDPVLEIETLHPTVSLTEVSDLIFTSPNGVTAFTANAPARDFTVWAVGTATAQAARAAGFERIHDANGDGGDLSRLILDTADRSGHFLYAGPETPARDIAGALQPAGFDFSQAAFYRSAPRTPHRALSRLGELSHVLIHSPRAGALVGQSLRGQAFGPLRALCISEAAAHALTTALDLHTGNLTALGLQIDIAAHPGEDSLLALLDD